MPNEESYLNESLRKIAKGAGFVLIGTLIGRAFGYGSRLIIARLGASDYGLVALGFAMMSIAAILSLVGMQQGITRYVSFYKGKEDKGRIKGTIISALKITLPLSLILAFILFWYANWISIHVFHDARLTTTKFPLNDMSRSFYNIKFNLILVMARGDKTKGEI
jgi:O-antigen/teichoic acid export membrane protein